MRDTHRTRERVDLHLDNRQIVSFVIGSLVVLGVVFALGVLVGKQLAMTAHGEPAPANPLAALDAKEAVRTGEAPVAADAGMGALTTYAEELTKPKPSEPTLARPAKPDPAQKPEPKAPKAEPKADAKADSKAAKAQPEPADEDEAAQPAEPKPAAATGERPSLSSAFDKAGGGEGFSLQVASLTNREDAETVVAKLEGKGYAPFIVEADVAGKGRYYRVRVGSYQTREDANAALKKLKQKTSMNAIVTNAR